MFTKWKARRAAKIAARPAAKKSAADIYAHSLFSAARHPGPSTGYTQPPTANHSDDSPTSDLTSTLLITEIATSMFDSSSSADTPTSNDFSGSGGDFGGGGSDGSW